MRDNGTDGQEGEGDGEEAEDVYPEPPKMTLLENPTFAWLDESTFTTLWVFFSLGIGLGYTVLVFSFLFFLVDILEITPASDEEAKPVKERKEKEKEQWALAF